MKKLSTLLAFVCPAILFLTGLCSTGTAFAQTQNEEVVMPVLDLYVVRELSRASINGREYTDVTVEITAAGFLNEVFGGVKVVVRENETETKIYRKRFAKSFLYAFADRTLRVGRGEESTQLLVYRDDDENWEMTLQEKGI